MLINILFTLDQPNYLFYSSYSSFSCLIINVTIGFTHLLFPLTGLLAYVSFKRYEMMKQSFAILSTKLIIFFTSESIIRFCLMSSWAKAHQHMFLLCTQFYSIYQYWYWLVWCQWYPIWYRSASRSFFYSAQSVHSLVLLVRGSWTTSDILRSLKRMLTL